MAMAVAIKTIVRRVMASAINSAINLDANETNVWLIKLFAAALLDVDYFSKDYSVMSQICIAVVVSMLVALANLHAANAPNSDAKAGVKDSHFNAKQVFDYKQPIIFQDDFRSGLGKWKLAIDAVEDRALLDKQAGEKRVSVVKAPDSEEGRMALRCVVPRALGNFRSEIALPHEKGFHERWYGARIYVPEDWIFSPDDGGDIVLQWHGILGDERKTRGFPPLSIAIKNDQWAIHRAFGPTDDIKRDAKFLEEPVQKGKWAAWVVHVRWSSGTNGLVQIWKDGKQVWEVNGPNTYLSEPVVPYFKTGLYHPEWKKGNEEKFKQAETAVTERVIYTAEVKIGDERAKYEDVAPALAKSQN